MHARSHAARRHACARCPAAFKRRAELRAHASVHTGERPFHCDECDTFVDRKDFILHMSLHAVEYAARHEKKPKPVRRVRRVKRRKPEAKDENANDERGGRKGGTGVGDVRRTPDSESDPQDNEFSDHSDAEYGFGPLPESVFEAIEDSQDGQPTIDAEVDSSGIGDVEAPGAPIGTAESVVVVGPSETPVDKIDPPAESSGPPAGNDENPPAAPAPPPSASVKSHKKPRTCPTCGKVYTASSSYFYHMKHAHRGAREHECDVCGKRFGTRAGLAQHAAVHSAERRFECQQCAKRFRSRAALYIHAQAHSGVRRWACAQCGRAFRWRAHLARHAARHRPARAHACSACGRAFSVRADLLRHARTHTRAAHACAACPLKFAQLRYLKVHVERKHAGLPPGPTPTPPVPSCPVVQNE
ncbi:zinc finger protein 316-like [Ostrinia furnacalis]|uniref:zinc finger protein 316-like n=1 Tax=Ostrinia furnacalis TaxID=93504 RepID=UPI0010394AF2|nr:zinc finger protein 316-like [Ostrinia furnacalis]